VTWLGLDRRVNRATSLTPPHSPLSPRRRRTRQDHRRIAVVHPTQDDPGNPFPGCPRRPRQWRSGGWRTSRVRNSAPRVLMALKVNWAIPAEAHAGRPSISPVEPVPFPHRPRRLGPPEDGGGRDRAHVVRRAGDAILGAIDTFDRFDPMLPAALRFAADHGETLVVTPLLSAWKAQAAGGPDHARRFPWSLGHDALPKLPGDRGTRRAWRPVASARTRLARSRPDRVRPSPPRAHRDRREPRVPVSPDDRSESPGGRYGQRNPARHPAARRG
jgi:hypothetical protein